MIAMAQLVHCLLSYRLFRGAIWEPMWGTWWVWDARLTAELILFFLYLGILALYSAFSDRNIGAKAAGILCITTGRDFTDYSFFGGVVEHITSKRASITKSEKPSIANSNVGSINFMYLRFYACIIWLTLVRYRVELLKEDAKRPPRLKH